MHVGAKLNRDQNFRQILSKHHSNMLLKKNKTKFKASLCIWPFWPAQRPWPRPSKALLRSQRCWTAQWCGPAPQAALPFPPRPQPGPGPGKSFPAWAKTRPERSRPSIGIQRPSIDFAGSKRQPVKNSPNPNSFYFLSPFHHSTQRRPSASASRRG
jgi:hypothetical protein